MLFKMYDLVYYEVNRFKLCENFFELDNKKIDFFIQDTRVFLLGKF